MRRVLFLFLFPVSMAHAGLVQTSFGTGRVDLIYQSFNGFKDYQTFTIPAQVQNTTILSSFPIVIAGTFTYLKNVDNGGLVTEKSGADIVFSTVGPGLLPYLNIDTEVYVNTTGKLTAWVQIPIVFGTQSVNIYMSYGNPLITSRVVWSTNTWDSNYKLVAHYPNGTTLGMFDATSNANNGSASGDAAAITGKVDGAVTLDGTGDDVNHASGASLDNFTTRTIECWIKSAASNVGRMFQAKGLPTIPGNGQAIGLRGGGILDFRFSWSGAAAIWGGSTDISGTVNPFHIGIAYDKGSSSNLPLMYVNGSAETVGTVVGASGSGNDDSANSFATGQNGGAGNYWNGYVDEIRYSNILRSQDWIRTSYLNQNDPTNFAPIQPKNIIQIQ